MVGDEERLGKILDISLLASLTQPKEEYDSTLQKQEERFASLEQAIQRESEKRDAALRQQKKLHDDDLKRESKKHAVALQQQKEQLGAKIVVLEKRISSIEEIFDVRELAIRIEELLLREIFGNDDHGYQTAVKAWHNVKIADTAFWDKKCVDKQTFKKMAHGLSELKQWENKIAHEGRPRRREINKAMDTVRSRFSRHPMAIAFIDNIEANRNDWSYLFSNPRKHNRSYESEPDRFGRSKRSRHSFLIYEINSFCEQRTHWEGSATRVRET